MHGVNVLIIIFLIVGCQRTTHSTALHWRHESFAACGQLFLEPGSFVFSDCERFERLALPSFQPQLGTVC